MMMGVVISGPVFLCACGCVGVCACFCVKEIDRDLLLVCALCVSV